MKRLAGSVCLPVTLALIFGALACFAAATSGVTPARTPERPIAAPVRANAPPPASVEKCPPLPKWVLDAKALARPLEQTMLRSSFPPSIDYSKYLTLTRCQDGSGGCFLYAALAVIDILKEREHPYTPDLSYRYAQYYYDNRQVAQKKVHTDYGSCAEACLHSDYDALVWVQDHFDDSKCPAPTAQNDAQAKRYRMSDTSDPVTPTVGALKSLLVSKDPLWACGTIGGTGHCIALVGYDDSQNAFRFINSWGDRWNGDGYGLIPYSQVQQTLSYVTYFTNRPSERAGTPDAYTARIRVRHQHLRNELTVAVGLEGEPPMIVWDRPNETGPPEDYNKDLDIDVPLPEYAASHWPPSSGNLWYVKVADGDPNGKAATVEEVTLARLTKSGSGKDMTELRRPHMKTFSIPDGGSRKIYVGAKAPATSLTLTPSPATVSPGERVVLSGVLSVQSFDTDGPPAAMPLGGKQIQISAIVSPADTVEQSQWRKVGAAVTDAAGKFSISVSPAQTTAYIAAYTKPDGQIIARSAQCQVTAAARKAAPPHRLDVPIKLPR